uniref:Ig-like domain-containing protein n=1 Tax=Esox lucius TaxID=8010 RepID=A0AAY5KY13_ESOLU
KDFALKCRNIQYEDNLPVRSKEQGYEGEGVTLSCKYTGSSAIDTLLWYQQYLGSIPELLLLITEGGYKDKTHYGLSVKLNDEKTRVDLEIFSVEVTDSALYYCAVRPTVTGNPKTRSSTM